MRADTHYSIVVRDSEYEKPKYTFSQVCMNLKLRNNVKFMKDENR